MASFLARRQAAIGTGTRVQRGTCPKSFLPFFRDGARASSGVRALDHRNGDALTHAADVGTLFCQ
jgi:hypothetical protein